MRCLFLDLDGTLVGAGASFLRDAEGGFSLAGARALEACHRAGVEVFLYSGRRRAQLHEDARLLGCSGYVFEAGGGIEVDGEVTWPAPEREGTWAAIEASGAPRLLLEHFAGRLEVHAPWHTQREVSHLLRGRIDLDEAHALLARHGLDGVRLLDNGGTRRASPALAGLGELRVYHLVPAGVSKAGAVAQVIGMRGYDPAECVAVGDSPEDVVLADVLGTFWVIGDAPAGGRANVRRASELAGAGVYEAVVTTLAEGL